ARARVTGADQRGALRVPVPRGEGHGPAALLLAHVSLLGRRQHAQPALLGAGERGDAVRGELGPHQVERVQALGGAAALAREAPVRLAPAPADTRVLEAHVVRELVGERGHALLVLGVVPPLPGTLTVRPAEERERPSAR